MEREYLEECLSKGMSLKAIAREQNCAPGTVGYWVRKHGLKANGSLKFDPAPTVTKEEVEPLVEAGMSLREMAEELGATPQAIHRRLQASGLATKAMERREIIRQARSAGANSVLLECPRHGLTDFWVGATVTRCRKCNSRGVARRRRKVKSILIAEAGGRCAVCGYDRFPVALEFHHLDPGDKSFGLSHAGITRSIEASRAEAAKCVLLCANCHAEVEAGFAHLPVQ